MKIGYLRISSLTQNLDRQRKQYVNSGYTIFEETCSGSISFSKREKASEILCLANDGKVEEFHVWEIDRLGRNQMDILNTLSFFEEKKIPVYITSMGICSLTKENKRNHIFQLIVSVLSTLAQQELEHIKERQMEGIMVAKEKGKYKGRKKGAKNISQTDYLKKHDDVVECLQSHMSNRTTARVTKKSLFVVKKVRKLLVSESR